MTRRPVTAARRHAWSSVNHRTGEAARRRKVELTRTEILTARMPEGQKPETWLAWFGATDV
jgi:hypothetical protein